MNKSISYRLGIGARWFSVIFTILAVIYFYNLANRKLTPITDLGNLTSGQLLLVGILVIANTLMFLGRNARDPKRLTRFFTRFLSWLFGLAAQLQGFGVLGYLLYRRIIQNQWQPSDGTAYLFTLCCALLLTIELDIYADHLWSWAQPRLSSAPPTDPA